MKKRFKIALVNHALAEDASHWAPVVSIRLQRALRQARRLRKAGRYAMLFAVTDSGTLQPISLKVQDV